MQEKPKLQVVDYAMHYGVALGFFWVFKYLFHIGASFYPNLELIYGTLSIGTIFFLYYLTTRYRDKINQGHITYGHSVLFSVLICLFASLIEAVVSYLHYTVIDPAYISSINAQVIEMMKKMDISPRYVSEADRLSFSPLYYTVSQIIGNTFFGLIISLLYSPFIAQKEKFK